MLVFVIACVEARHFEEVWRSRNENLKYIPLVHESRLIRFKLPVFGDIGRRDVVLSGSRRTKKKCVFLPVTNELLIGVGGVCRIFKAQIWL